jgi:hypothetical protein
MKPERLNFATKYTRKGTHPENTTDKQCCCLYRYVRLQSGLKKRNDKQR